jgi:hypothetical protein
MTGASTPTPKDVARALKRLTEEQFAQVCSETGILEITLPGASQAARADALVAMTQGHSDFVVLVRAINRIAPGAWRAAPALGALSSLAYGAIAFVVILGLGGLALMLIITGSPSATELPPTPTETLAPTRTPVPTFTYTPSSTPEPTASGTPTATASRTPRPTDAHRSPTPTHTLTPPPVSIVYPEIEPQAPQSGYKAYPGDTVEFRWILRNVNLAADERYWMRIYLQTSVVDSYVTADPWRFYVVPPGAIGDFTWTVTVVKVDAQGNIIGPLSPESDPWAIGWKS